MPKNISKIPTDLVQHQDDNNDWFNNLFLADEQIIQFLSGIRLLSDN